MQMHFTHFMIFVFIASLLATALVIAAVRWAALFVQAYQHVKDKFRKKSISYSTLMQDYTKGSLEVVTLDAESIKDQSPRFTNQEVRQRRDALALPSALGEASISGALMLRDLLSVDGHFYDAMSSMAGHQITSFADLHQQVSDYATNGFGEISSHVIDNVQGHLAEQLVAEHLRHLGHHVEMAATSNQNGWDMIVDHAFRVNVKDYAHPNNFSDHFQHHPDVAVIVPHAISSGVPDFDAGSGLDHIHHAFQTHQNIISDGGLDHDAVVNHAHHALDAAHGHVPMHFPIITVCLSGWREGKLLLDGSTDLTRSATNVALDAAGTGIGGVTGKLTGAFIGTAILPGVGTVVGGILGAIVGGMGGRAITNNIKEAPLREARDNYFVSRAATQSLMDKTRVIAERKYAGFVLESNNILVTEKSRLQKILLETKNACNNNLLQAACFNDEEMAGFTAKIRTYLHEEKRQAEEQMHRSWHKLKLFWPDAQFVYNYVFLKFSQQRNDQFVKKFVQIQMTSASAPVRTAAYLQIALNLGYGLEEAKKHFSRISHQSFHRQKLPF